MRNQRGYGYMVTERYGSTNRLSAHRFAWMLANGKEIPTGMVVRHTCDNPPCCNPEHLLVGTHADNMADMDARGRRRHNTQRGSAASAAKLTDAEAATIRADYFAGGVVQKTLAQRYGVSISAISLIVKGRTYCQQAGDR